MARPSFENSIGIIWQFQTRRNCLRPRVVVHRADHLKQDVRVMKEWARMPVRDVPLALTSMASMPASAIHEIGE